MEAQERDSVLLNRAAAWHYLEARRLEEGMARRRHMKIHDALANEILGKGTTQDVIDAMKLPSSQREKKLALAPKNPQSARKSKKLS